MLTVSLGFLLAAFAVGAVDGVYFHLHRFRLFASPAARAEHGLHGLRAGLVVPVVVALYLVTPGGLLLLGALAAVLADVAVMAADLAVERRSRRAFGGLPHAEYVIHVVANGLHAVALALAFASRPAAAWRLDAPFATPAALPAAAWWLVAALAVVAAASAVHHLVLYRRPVSARAPHAPAGLRA